MIHARWHTLIKTAVLVSVFLALLALCTAPAWGKVQTFELGKKMQERVFLCLDLKVVEPMFDFAVKGDMESVKMLSYLAQTQGKCGAFEVEITYKNLLKEGKDADGNVFTIYEAVVQDITVYVPLRNYRHRGDA